MSAQRPNAIGLPNPSSLAAVAGRPKIPEPMMPLRASAVRSQRVMARTRDGFSVATVAVLMCARMIARAPSPSGRGLAVIFLQRLHVEALALQGADAGD